MIPESLSRTALLLGEEATEALRGARVAVFGLGGVGGYVVEALARTGVGKFVLVDNDTVALSNLNRQIIALHSTLGLPKTQVMRERILQINPKADIAVYNTFYLPGNPARLTAGCDYIVDAIDTVSGKIALVEESLAEQVPIISCMGAGNKRNPSLFEVADLTETSVCPLCRVMRRELKKRGIANLKVVYSREKPLAPESVSEDTARKPTPGSLMYVTATAGLLAASVVVEELTQSL